MFSSITEAWDYNPVNEITNKLTKGSFQEENVRADIFDFKQKQKSNHRKCTTDLINLSDDSMHLLSENASGSGDDSFLSTYSPIKSKPKKKRVGSDKPHIQSVDFSEFESDHSVLDLSSDRPTPTDFKDSRCTYSVRHLSKCQKCSKKLNRLINKKVNEKINDILLNDRLNQIKNIRDTPSLPKSDVSGLSDTWKDTLIIIIGAIIAIFIIYLTTKSLCK